MARKLKKSHKWEKILTKHFLTKTNLKKTFFTKKTFSKKKDFLTKKIKKTFINNKLIKIEN